MALLVQNTIFSYSYRVPLLFFSLEYCFFYMKLFDSPETRKFTISCIVFRGRRFMYWTTFVGLCLSFSAFLFNTVLLHCLTAWFVGGNNQGQVRPEDAGHSGPNSSEDVQCAVEGQHEYGLGAAFQRTLKNPSRKSATRKIVKMFKSS